MRSYQFLPSIPTPSPYRHGHNANPGASGTGSFDTISSVVEPYRYRVRSEAMPFTLPQACNTPQRCKYDLFSEQLNGAPFVLPRASLLHTWFDRIRPPVAHRPLRPLPKNSDVEAFFSPANSNVQFTPDDMSWARFPLPGNGESDDFIQGLKMIADHGDPAAAKDGLAVHIYTANVSMANKAFCNNDGDLMILPQESRLDIQTEYVLLMVRPGELVVVQAGIRFKVTLPDGAARGYIQEIFSSHYKMPELWALRSERYGHAPGF